MIEKLYSIIKVYCKQLPTYVPIRTYTKISKKERMFKNKQKKETVQFVNLKKSMNANNIMANKEKPKLIRITKLLPKIKKLIFQQKVNQNKRQIDVARFIRNSVDLIAGQIERLHVLDKDRRATGLAGIAYSLRYILSPHDWRDIFRIPERWILVHEIRRRHIICHQERTSRNGVSRTLWFVWCFQYRIVPRIHVILFDIDFWNWSEMGYPSITWNSIRAR